jgi:malate synthase
MPIRTVGPDVDVSDRVLTAPALAFVEDLTRRFRGRIDELLSRRRERQARLEGGAALDFLPETSTVRQGDWKVAPAPADLQDRRMEITGPVDRKMIINALNSGAQVFMADFEDANSPTWANVVRGQANLIDAVRRTISYIAPGTGKRYTLNPQARGTFERGATSDELAEFLTLPAYDLLVAGEVRGDRMRQET